MNPNRPLLRELLNAERKQQEKDIKKAADDLVSYARWEADARQRLRAAKVRLLEVTEALEALNLDDPQPAT